MTYKEAAKAANDAIAKALRLCPDLDQKRSWREMYHNSDEIVDDLAEDRSNG